MKRTSIAALVLAGSLAFGGIPALIYASSMSAPAAEKQKQKKQQKSNVNRPRPKQKSYCGYDQEPVPASMSDSCWRAYLDNCRRGIGCNQFGR